MELVFIRIKESKWCDQAEPIVDLFAKEKNLKLTKYVDLNDIPEKYNQMKVYPVLFFVNDGEIVGHQKGYSDDEKTMRSYENQLKDLSTQLPVKEI